jgi:hypothetical protein
MYSFEPWIQPVIGEAAGAVTEQPHVLAGALVQLLGRDDELPARWLSPSFAREVQADRADLRTITSLAGLRSISRESTVGSPFRAAVAGLTRDPVHVAVAIRHLEILHGQALPTWSDLVRRGVPPGFAPADAALWFG